MKFLVYYRVSTKGQGDSGLGLEAQRAYVHHFLPQGVEIVAEVTEVESAKSLDDRPVLQAAVCRCKAEGLILAVAKLDRLSRRTEDALHLFSELGGKLWSADVPNLDKFTLTIFMSIADRERELISLRTKQALAAKKERDGSVHPVKGHAGAFSEADRARAIQRKRERAQRDSHQVVLTIRALRAGGEEPGEIADKLNAHGHSSPWGGGFYATTVRRIMARESIA